MDNVLLYSLHTILIYNAICVAVLFVAFFICFLLRQKISFKKATINCFVILFALLCECGILTVPRAMDLTKQDYVTIKNATIIIMEMNEFDGSLFVWGTGKIKANNGKRITVTGTKFIDLPTDSSPYQEINGTFTYAKRSKQLLKLEVKNTNFSD